MTIRLSDDALQSLAKAGSKDAQAQVKEREEQFTEWITAQAKIRVWAKTPEELEKIIAANHHLVERGMTPYEATLYIAENVKRVLNPERYSHDSNLPPRA